MAGEADPWDPDRDKEVSLQKAADHLIHFRCDEKDKKGEYHYPFAQDPLFVCWIGNVCHRHKVIQQVGVYMNTHIADQNYTRAQLHEMAQSWKFDALIKRVGSYVANVTMTPEYWRRERKKLTSLHESEGCFDAFLTWSYCRWCDGNLTELHVPCS